MMNRASTEAPRHTVAVEQDAPAAHSPVVQLNRGTRYPYQAVCSCSWTSRGYVREHAAQTMADAHQAGEL